MLAPVYAATHLHWFPMELKRAYSNDNCLLPMPLPWCYIAHVCWVFCVLSFFAYDVAFGAVVRVLRALHHVFCLTIVRPLCFYRAGAMPAPLYPATHSQCLQEGGKLGEWKHPEKMNNIMMQT